ncbi:hypothetical protein K7432_007201 [Basidiobolus ranarum]|uniref:2'-5' RNA ligase n=1 Tax=Basidiobolus ranarum TaxID=34480 RepID=A0ABR2W0F5_9FUNG
MSAVQSSARTFKSAVCIIPPSTLWKPIQDIREIHDKHVKRWPPHINLLYPYLPYEEFSNVAIPKLLETLSTVKPFRLKLTQFHWFQHSKNSSTAWLKPASIPEDALENLERCMVEAFPDFNDQLNIGSEGFTPHLSVGQFRSKGQVELKVAELNQLFDELEPLEFEVTSVQLINRSGYHDPFRVIQDIPLGG